MHCCGKGLTVEPLGQGHIFRTQMRVKGGNKTVRTTYLGKGGGGSSEEPDEGNLHVRFCRGAHSNIGGYYPNKRCAMGSTRHYTDFIHNLLSKYSTNASKGVS